jgi:NAD(P)-dependent dehydrogenase (short-subunit alcohol dehydrogenase family)
VPSESDPLAGRSALITGGASGIGLATAELLAERGARVLICDLDERAGVTAAKRLGGHFTRTDVSSFEQNAAAVATAVEHYGGLDLAFLNAGVSTGCGVGDDFNLELYRRAMGANIDGVVFGIHAALPELRKGGGAIVSTASLAGLTAVPMDPLYAANKHAVVGLTRSLGPGLAAEGVRINAICPGFADTAIIGPFKSDLEAGGIPIIPAAKVAETAVRLFEGEESGECWFIQPGREPGPFRFPNLPGPRG